MFQFLIPYPDFEPIGGNFHKFITNAAGLPVAQFVNSTFIEGEGVQKYTKGWVASKEEELFNFQAVLEEIIETGVCTNEKYAYAPYKINQ